MAINFPNAPTHGQSFAGDDDTWIWDSINSKWGLQDSGQVHYTAGNGIVLVGTALSANVGTSPLQIIQLDNSSKLPAVDGSQLTGIATGYSYTGVTPVNNNTILADSDNSYYLINNYEVVAFTITIAAVSGTAAAAWKIEGLAKRTDYVSTVIVNSNITVISNTWVTNDPSVTITGGNDAPNYIQILATGNSTGSTIKWAASMSTTIVSA